MKQKVYSIKNLNISAEYNYTYPEIKDIVDKVVEKFKKIKTVLISKKTNILKLFTKDDLNNGVCLALFYEGDEEHKDAFNLLSSSSGTYFHEILGESLFVSLPFFLPMIGKKNYLKMHIQNMQALGVWKFSNILWVINSKLAKTNAKEDLPKMKVISAIYILYSLCGYSWDETYYRAVEVLTKNELIRASRTKVTQFVKNAIPKRYRDITDLFEKSNVLAPIKTEHQLKNILETKLGTKFVELFFNYPSDKNSELIFTFLMSKALVAREIMNYGLIARHKSNEPSNMIGREMRKVIFNINKELLK